MQDVSSEHSQHHHILNKRTKPSWMENVTLNNDLIFKYQLTAIDIAETLATDLIFLNDHEQVAVNFIEAHFR